MFDSQQNFGQVRDATTNLEIENCLLFTRSRDGQTFSKTFFLFDIFHPDFQWKMWNKYFGFFTCIYTEKCGNKQQIFFIVFPSQKSDIKHDEKCLKTWILHFQFYTIFHFSFSMHFTVFFQVKIVVKKVLNFSLWFSAENVHEVLVILLQEKS